MKLSNIFSHIKTGSKLQVKKADASASGKPKAEAASASSETDRVELSASSMDVQKAREVLEQTPAVRAEKVQALKEQIERGEYQVDSYKVADKMLISLISDNISD